ncbi:hypothetical protein V6N11_029904 [Hibiscus sabdariffa]|uniref:Uncharacterized protein n=1 Tax=Hibiscus sabdariffa TaxID=183260 RepID=A0ABR2PJP5_9ROSI
MEVAIRAGGSKNCSFAAVRDHISLALGPAVVLDSIRELEKVTIQGATQFLEDNFVADDRYILNVKRSVGIASNWGRSLKDEVLRRGVPRHVSFVTDYCNWLLDDNSRLILTQVLRIYRSWKQENYEEELDIPYSERNRGELGCLVESLRAKGVVLHIHDEQSLSFQ